MSIRGPEPGRAGDTQNGPEPGALTWTRAQLRKQIQRAGAAWAPAARPADSLARETGRPPVADMEAEP